MQPGEPKTSTRRAASSRLTLLRALTLVFVVALSLFIFSLRDRVEELAIYGYAGIFIIIFMAYATVILPAPGVAMISLMGATLHPPLVALVAGVGAALGELTGYLVGFSGQGVAERSRLYERLTYWMERNGSLTILVLSAVPNPFFDLAGVVAGALKMRPARFLFFCWIGETLKMLMFAYLGAGIFKFLE